MTTTFTDLLDQLKQEDEVTILEILNISSNDLVEALEPFIWEKQERIRDYYGEDDETLDW